MNTKPLIRIILIVFGIFGLALTGCAKKSSSGKSSEQSTTSVSSTPTVAITPESKKSAPAFGVSYIITGTISSSTLNLVGHKITGVNLTSGGATVQAKTISLRNNTVSYEIVNEESIKADGSYSIEVPHGKEILLTAKLSPEIVVNTVIPRIPTTKSSIKADLSMVGSKVVDYFNKAIENPTAIELFKEGVLEVGNIEKIARISELVKDNLSADDIEAIRDELIASNKDRIQAMKNSNLSESQIGASIDESNVSAHDSTAVYPEFNLTSTTQLGTIPSDSSKWVEKILRNSAQKQKLLAAIAKLTGGSIVQTPVAAEPDSTQTAPTPAVAAEPDSTQPTPTPVVAVESDSTQPVPTPVVAVESDSTQQPAPTPVAAQPDSTQPTPTPVAAQPDSTQPTPTPVVTSPSVPTDDDVLAAISPVIIIDATKLVEGLPLVPTEPTVTVVEEVKPAVVEEAPVAAVVASSVDVDDVKPAVAAPVELDIPEAVVTPVPVVVTTPVPVVVTTPVPVVVTTPTPVVVATVEPAVVVEEARAVPPKPATMHTGCMIEQAVCKNNPRKIGYFKDSDKLAQTDVNRCMKRALDYSLYCGNAYKDVTIARYYLDDKINETSDTTTGCVIDQDACLKYPTKVGNFMDNSGSASSNPARCQLRAMEFYNWCGNKITTVTTATFYDKGTATFFASTASGCLVEQAECRHDSRKAGTFFDNYQNSSTDQVRCLKRAFDYHNWCQNSFEIPTIARFYADGKVAGEKDSQSGCNMELKACINNPTRSLNFLDNYQSSDIDQDRCLKRALEYHMSCGNTFADVVTASFYEKGTKLGTQNTLSGCVIDQDTCVKYPKKVGDFMDNSKSASYDETICLGRAREYNTWCGNAFENVTTATYYNNGEVVAKKDTTTGCVIEEAECRNYPSYTGRFMDYKNGADQLALSCTVRAVQMHKWCGNSFGSFTKATFYENKIEKATASSSTGCYIDLKVCQKYPTKAREDAFIDDANNATTVSANCLLRADYYYKLCGNTASDVTTATYYENGIKKVSKSMPLSVK